ncbi:hypothetical protein GCM10010528_13350 [Gordonia defluvii]|uniref:HTH tetR-type domain-containing protein n=1 Tax=Gordonia defluvii TaxID=283718 RepID=A0ABP6L650_9ACTN|nr:TetR/AcrR family transcriptional regulator [Gordonia sp. UBA5067]
MPDNDSRGGQGSLSADEVLAIIGPGPDRAALPRHRHQLTAAQVEESQRWRLIAATAEVIARQGYSQTSVDQISAQAGVSKKSFYKFFADKEAAFIAAYDAIGLVIATMTADLPGNPADLDALMGPVIGAYLGTLQAAPAFTTMFLLRAQGATPGIADRRIAGVARYAEAISQILCRGRDQGIPIADVSPAEVVALLGGINELCIQQVQRHGVARLDEIADTVLSFTRRVLTP